MVMLKVLFSTCLKILLDFGWEGIPGTYHLLHELFFFYLAAADLVTLYSCLTEIDPLPIFLCHLTFCRPLWSLLSQDSFSCHSNL